MDKQRFTYIRTADGNVQCPHCEYIRPAKNISSVHEHIKAKHSGTFKHKCKHCPYESAVKQNLDTHIMSRHPEHSIKKQKEHVCPSEGCQYAANTRGQLRSHYLLKHLSDEVQEMLGTTQEGQILCTCCGVDFKSKPAFIYHTVNCLSPEILANAEVQEGLGLAVSPPVTVLS
jgi:hypothetical protein